MSTEVASTMRDRGLGRTERRDLWWLGPSLTAVCLGAFVVYATFRAFYNADYQVVRADSAYLLSPFYSPLIVLPWLPAWISPAFLILWAPGGFRVTCYYYRKAYYRAYFLDPPACAVGEARGHSYRGETRLLLFQNLHRYFLYFALVFLVILAIDVVHACIWPASGGGSAFGVSVGNAGAGREYRVVDAVHILVPLAAASGGRQRRLLFVRGARPVATSRCGRALPR